MTISAVMPLYNKAANVSAAIESICNQTLPADRIFVVDDGSTDDGPALVERMNIPHLTLIRQSNAGPGSARNVGIRLAQSRFVAFLDADDVWLPNHLQVLHTLASQQPGLRMYANRLQRLDSFKEVAPSGPVTIQKVNDYPSAWLDGLLLSTCAIMVDRQAALEVHGFEVTSYRGEDLALWLKLACGLGLDEHHVIAVSDVVGALYRTDASELTAKPSAAPDAAMLLISKVLASPELLSKDRYQMLVDFKAKLALLHAAEWIRHGGRQEARDFLRLGSETRRDRGFLRQLSLLTGPLWPVREAILSMRKRFMRQTF